MPSPGFQNDSDFAASERQEDSLRFTAALPSGDVEAKTGEV